MIVRSKMHVTGVTHQLGPCGPDGVAVRYVKIHFSAVYSKDPETENATFFKYTPNGQLTRLMRAEEAEGFQPGTFWYIDHERTSVKSTPELQDDDLWQLRKIEMQGDSLAIRLGGMQDYANSEEMSICNQGVHGEYRELGALYRLTFTPTTREGT